MNAAKSRLKQVKAPLGGSIEPTVTSVGALFR